MWGPAVNGVVGSGVNVAVVPWIVPAPIAVLPSRNVTVSPLDEMERVAVKVTEGLDFIVLDELHTHPFTIER